MKLARGYSDARGGGAPPVAIDLRQGEQLVGWYQNPPPFAGIHLIFTTKALIEVQGARLTRIEADEIKAVEQPPSKTDVVGLWLDTSRARFFVHVAGPGLSGANTKAVYSLLMVLLAVVRMNGRKENSWP